MKKVELTTLQNGLVIDMFNEEFQKVMQNIADDNVKPDAVREISIKLQIKPDKTRQTAVTKIDVKSKLANVMAREGMMFMGNENGSPVAYEDVYEQQEMDIEEKLIYKMAEVK